jgi:hypothetical protein
LLMACASLRHSPVLPLFFTLQHMRVRVEHSS